MTKRTVFASLAVALGFTACKQQAGGDAPWLTMPTADEHAARFFPANAGTPHEAADCGDCHLATDDSFKQFQCYGCHTGSHGEPGIVGGWHAAVPDFASTSAACKQCHPDGLGIASSIDHAPFFPIAAGTSHAGVGCMSCHNDRANRLDLACAGCHPHEQATTATQHALVASYAFASALCVRCHAESQVDPVAAHTAVLPEPFVIVDVPGGNSHVGIPGGECLRCHVREVCAAPPCSEVCAAPPCPPLGVDFLPAMRVDKPWAADFKVFTCVNCHNQADIDDKHFDPINLVWDPLDYKYTTADCRRCHPGGKK